MVSNSQKVRIVSVAIYIAVMAAMWDIWWHQAISSTDPFWILPHILFYFSVAVALAISVLTWWQSQDYHWRNVALAGAVFGAIFFFSAQLVYTNILPMSSVIILSQIIISAFGGAMAGVLAAKLWKNRFL